jgi:hypothetical protein
MRFGSHGFSFLGLVTCKDTKTPFSIYTIFVIPPNRKPNQARAERKESTNTREKKKDKGI